MIQISDRARDRVYITQGLPQETGRPTKTTDQRSLTSVQRALILQRVKPLIDQLLQRSDARYITFGVAYSPLAHDAAAYANQFAAALTDAGLRPRGVVPMDHTETKNFPGIWIRKVSSWGAPEDPPIAEELQNALHDGGIGAQVSWASMYAMTTFELIVGSAVNDHAS